MRDVFDETSDVAFVQQTRDPFRDVAEQAKRIPQEVHGPENLGGLTLQFLQNFTSIGTTHVKKKVLRRDVSVQKPD